MGVQIIKTNLGSEIWVNKYVPPKIQSFEGIQPEKQGQKV